MKTLKNIMLNPVVILLFLTFIVSLAPRSLGFSWTDSLAIAGCVFLVFCTALLVFTFLWSMYLTASEEVDRKRYDR